MATQLQLSAYDLGANTNEGFAIGNINTYEDLFQEAFRWRNTCVLVTTP